ncbi:AMP-dependent synthetase/ligase [Streptomyces capparidis]
MPHPLARAKDAGHLADRAPVEVERSGGEVRRAATPALAPPPGGSLADLPYVNAAEEPGAVVFARRAEDPGQGRAVWRDVTAAAFAEEVTALAKGLIASGVEPGGRVVVMSRTSYEWTLFDFAAWAAGAMVVPVYPTASAEQAAWIVRDCGAVACVAEDAACAEVLHRAVDRATAEGSPVKPPVWRVDDGAVRTLTERGRGVPDAELRARRAALGPGSEATVIYTSGTTGRPKGVPLTHGNFLAEAANTTELLHPVFRSVSSEPASTLMFLPLAHVLGRSVQVACVRARIRLGHAPSIKPDDLRPDLESFRPTFLLGVPYLFEKIHHLGRVEAQGRKAERVYDRAVRVAVECGRAELDALAGRGPGPGPALRARRALFDLLVYRKVRAALGGAVRYAISGGSSLDPELLLFFAGAGVLVYEGYGLTETTGATTVNPPLRPRPGTVGPPVPGSAVRIGDDGEVWLRGPHVFAGYQGEARGAVEDGWFPTGDLGRLDEDGYLTITGRKKELIVTSGGKNISPGPLEDRLRSHPLIGQAMVVGDGRAYAAALITLDAEAVAAHLAHLRGGGRDAGAAPTAEGGSAVPVHPSVLREVARAVDEANGTVSRAESVRRFRIVAGDFTEERGMLTPSLKVKRAVVAEVYAADIAALYGNR